MKKTNLWKALFSVAMSIFMVMTMLPSMIFAEYDLKGNGTESEPYLIESYDDLLEFARLVNDGQANQHAKLANNIYAQESEEESKKWTPIGVLNNAYKGIFDGKGNTIMGLCVKSNDIAGLFREISADAVVKNVKLQDSCIEGCDAGGVVVYNYGTVSGCSNTGTVTANEEYAFAGGVVVYNYGTVSGCSNTGMVTANGENVSAGGVVVENYGTVSGCSNTGTVTADGEYAFAGGLVMYNEGTVSGCSNTGTVKVKKTSSSSGEVVTDQGGSFAGGVVALNGRKVVACNNIGTVTVKGDDIYAGGIVGNNEDGITKDSYSIGEINIEEGNSFIGGVFGLANFSDGASGDGKTQNCYYDCNRCSAEKPIGKSEGKEPDSVKGLSTDEMTGTGEGRAETEMVGFKKGDGETYVWYFHDDDKADVVGQKYAYYPNLEEYTSADAWIPKVKIFYGTFNGGEGSTGTMPPEKFYDGISEKLFENQFVKAGYTFLNWKDSDGTLYENQKEVMLKEDTEFIAQWKGKPYKVKYNLNGGKMSTPEKTVVWNGKVLSEENPTRVGYDFTGWTYNGTIVAEDRTYEDLVSDDNVESIELTAQWSEKTYKVKYNLNGGEMSTPEKIVVWNGKVLPEENPTRVGYDFTGWMYNGTVIEDRTYKDLVSDDNVESIELTAQWQLKDSFTVKRTDEKLTDNNEELQSEVVIATPVNDVKTSDSYDLDMLFALIAIILVSGVGLLGMREKRKVK